MENIDFNNVDFGIIIQCAIAKRRGFRSYA